MDMHEDYPWCSVDDHDCQLRSFVFQEMISLEIKDKIAAMRDYVNFIKTGELPQKLKAVP